MEIILGILCVICGIIATRLWSIGAALRTIAKEIEFLRKHRKDC